MKLHDLTLSGNCHKARLFLSLIGQPVVQVDPRYFRPTEVETLLGDASKARAQLGWTPRIGLEEGIGLAYQDFLKRYT